MIARYSHQEMSRIWTDQNRYLQWLRVEFAVCEEMARMKKIPPKDWRELSKRVKALMKSGGVDPRKVEAHEAVTRHDVIAFTTAVAERIGPISRYIHYGLTSSDVVDTALSLQMQEAGQVLREELVKLDRTLDSLARKYRKLATIGRSHGIFAEPTSFGLKFLAWKCEAGRNLERLDRALKGVAFGKISGAVGVSAHWGPEIEEKVLKRLGLRREAVSTQVIPRDRHAEFVQVLALVGSSVERIAVELRHLQRSEVSEVMEGFSKGQKGSSAMPHKRNPISSENLTGCARVLRSYAQAALENVALWHERDISHSSVERIILPDACILLHYVLRRMNRVLAELVVRKERVAENLEAAGPIVFSGHVLLALVERGVTREDGYRWVQECALAHLEGKGEFLALMGAHPEIATRIPSKELRALVSLKHQLRNVDEIYRRAGGNARG